jgi:hypothetical protein
MLSNWPVALAVAQASDPEMTLSSSGTRVSSAAEK